MELIGLQNDVLRQLQQQLGAVQADVEEGRLLAGRVATLEREVQELRPLRELLAQQQSFLNQMMMMLPTAQQSFLNQMMMPGLFPPPHAASGPFLEQKSPALPDMKYYVGDENFPPAPPPCFFPSFQPPPAFAGAQMGQIPGLLPPPPAPSCQAAAISPATAAAATAPLTPPPATLGEKKIISLEVEPAEKLEALEGLLTQSRTSPIPRKVSAATIIPPPGLDPPLEDTRRNGLNISGDGVERPVAVAAANTELRTPLGGDVGGCTAVHPAPASPVKISIAPETAAEDQAAKLEQQCPSELLPSLGSAEHPGNCKPCAWYWKRGGPDGSAGCSNGSLCRFCHLCDEDSLKRKRKEKLSRLREEKRGQSLPEENAAPTPVRSSTTTW